MSFYDDEELHLSQLASDFIAPTAPRLPADEPTDFRSAFHSASHAQQPAVHSGSGEQDQFIKPLPRQARVRHGKVPDRHIPACHLRMSLSSRPPVRKLGPYTPHFAGLE